MSTPYTHTMELAVVPSAAALCVELPVPLRGIITRFIIRDMDDDVEGYTFDIFDREDACSTVSEDSSNANDNVALRHSDLHKILETQTVAAGTATRALYETALHYENQDERLASSGQHKKALWLELTPAGSGDKVFEVAYTVYGPQFG